MVQLADLFSVPEMALLCNVADYFERQHIDYHPEILFWDVKVRVGAYLLHPEAVICFCFFLDGCKNVSSSYAQSCGHKCVRIHQF